jgi:energy-coupling factor transporter transmembrane protein EcfT
VWFGLGIIGLIIWIAIAFWPARVAARKGHSFIGYFLLSLLFFPLSLIMAYVVDDRSMGDVPAAGSAPRSRPAASAV